MQRTWTLMAALAFLVPSVTWGQETAPGAMKAPGAERSRNVRVTSHLPLGRIFTTADIEIEQELSRPYVYVSKMQGTVAGAGFDIISIKDPERARVIYEWRIDNPTLHQGTGGTNPALLKSRGRYYLAQTFQFQATGPDADLGAIVFDVTGLPDTSKIKEVGRFRTPQTPGGFHESFAYRHSGGQALLVTTVQYPFANAWDIDRLVSGDPNQGVVSRIPIPDTAYGGSNRAYHDMYVGFDPVSRQDRFYGAGAGGYYVYDITDLANPRLLTSVTGVSGMQRGHTFTPTPDGRYAVMETEYQYAPLRIFDLKPGLDGQVKTISRPIGAWISDWTTNPHNHEVRWPYVFVSAYEEGLQVFNMMDPTNPYTVGYYDTYDGPHRMGRAPSGDPEARWNDRTYPIPAVSEVVNGAFGVDVRNADGLIVISDMTTGFWAFRMDGFDGWNGHQWGMPNVSSAQDWDNGPDGAAKKIS